MKEERGASQATGKEHPSCQFMRQESIQESGLWVLESEAESAWLWGGGEGESEKRILYRQLGFV